MRNYLILEQLPTLPSFLLFRAVCRSTRKRVLIKRHKSEYPSLQEIERLQNQWRLLSRFRHPHLVQALDWVEESGAWFLVTCDPQGSILSEEIEPSGVDLKTFFSYAIDLTQSLHYLHEQGWIHHGLDPVHIMRGGDQKLTLLDCNAALFLEEYREQQGYRIGSPFGSLSYISPEATGRIHCPIDFRSDLYSLGVIFYELLSGTLPFLSQDPLELIHAHLAKPPLELCATHSHVPPVLSQLVSRLLAKSPEDRYQTAHGLLQDLYELQERFLRGERLEGIVLGTQDIYPHPSFHDVFYGRKQELQVLCDAFEKAFTTTALILIEGVKGSGKTRLLEEFLAKMESFTFFSWTITFQEEVQELPYASFLRAVASFAQEFRFAPSQERQLMAQHLHRRLGHFKGLLCRVIPDLEEYVFHDEVQDSSLVYSSSYPFDAKEYEDLANGLFLVIEGIQEQSHKPCLLVFENVHFADYHSIKLLRRLLYEKKDTLLIITYAPEQLSQRHAVHALLEQLHLLPYASTLSLPALDAQEIRAWVELVLQQECEELAALLYKKAEGNLGSSEAFLLQWFKNKWVWFDTTSHAYDFSTEILERQPLSDPVALRHVRHLENLEPLDRQILAVAALIGVEFSLPLMSRVCKISQEGVVQQLQFFVDHQLLFAQGQRFFFSHSLIRNCAKNLLRETLITSYHLAIARCGAAYLSLSERLRHYKRSLDLLVDPQEMLEVAQLHLEMAVQEKKKRRFVEALEYLKDAQSLLHRGGSWNKCFMACFELYKEKGEVLFYLDEMEEFASIFEDLIVRTSDRNLKASIYALKQRLYVQKNRFIESIAQAREALRLYEIEIPETMSVRRLYVHLLHVQWLDMTHDVENLGQAESVEAFLITHIISNALLPLHQIDPLLCGYVACVGLKYVLCEGLTSSLRPVLMGSFLFLALFNKRRAREYFLWTRQLLLSDREFEDRGEVMTLAGAFLEHWFDPLSHNFTTLEEAKERVCAQGAFYYHGVACFMHSFLYLRTGERVDLNVNRLRMVRDQELDPFGGVGGGTIEGINAHIQALEILSTRHGYDLDVVQKKIRLVEESQNRAWIYASHAIFVYAYYVLEEYELAFKHAKEAVRYFTLSSLTFFADHHLLYIYLAMSHQERYQVELSWIESCFRFFQAMNPTNFQGFMHIVLAQKFFRKKTFQKSLHHLEVALGFFQKKHWIHYIALVNELQSQVYSCLGQRALCLFFLKEAYYHHQLHGNERKLSLLEQRHPHLFVPQMDSAASDHSTSYRQTLESALKMSQKLEHDPLIQEALIQILDTTQSSRVLLCVQKKGQVFVEACATGDRFDPMHLPIEQFGHIPQRTIEQAFSQHSLDPIDASKDSYCQQHQIHGALCLPLKRYSQEMALVYLEQSKPEPFRHHVLDALHILTTQLSISLENAAIYQAYRRFIPQQLLELLQVRSIHEASLGDHQTFEMTVLFVNLREWKEKIADVVRFERVHTIVKLVSRCVPSDQGFIDKFVGDTVMVLFQEATCAFEAAQKILAQAKKLSHHQVLEGNSPFDIGMGLHSGPLTLGIIGDPQRLEGSAFGDTVNVASRVAQMSSIHGTSLLLTQQSVERLECMVEFKDLGPQRLKGRQEPVHLFALPSCGVDVKS